MTLRFSGVVLACVLALWLLIQLWSSFVGLSPCRLLLSILDVCTELWLYRQFLAEMRKLGEIEREKER